MWATAALPATIERSREQAIRDQASNRLAETDHGACSLDKGYRTLYRIVRTNPVTERDMMSHMELGIPLRGNTPELREMWEGLSMFTSLERARKQAEGRPWQGNAHIAECISRST